MEYKYKVTIRLKEKPTVCKDCKLCFQYVDEMSEDEDIVGECRITYKNNWDYDKKVLESCPITHDSESYYVQYDSPSNKCKGCKLCIWTGFLEDNNVIGKCIFTGNKFTIKEAEESRGKDCPLIIEEL